MEDRNFSVVPNRQGQVWHIFYNNFMLHRVTCRQCNTNWTEENHRLYLCSYGAKITEQRRKYDGFQLWAYGRDWGADA